MASSRWITAELLGQPFRFETLPGLFSDDRIDEGTLLLLSALPDRPPASFLDLGCGYGALGLPIAARHPQARALLVDRNVLAVDQARANARTAGLTQVEAQPSLGYRDLAPEIRFDWVLSNIPARIGDAGIAYLIGEGARRLTPEGELRAVVIRDLRPVVERLGQQLGWDLGLRAEGPRHAVYSVGPLPSAAKPDTVDHESIYLRDRVRVGGFTLERPHDLPDEPAHLREGLPLLLELLPRHPLGETAVWSGGYGAAAVTLAQRGNAVTAADWDVLATTFSRRNVAEHGKHCADYSASEVAALTEKKWRLFVGELRPERDRQTALEDLRASAHLASEGCRVIWLGLTRPSRPLVEPLRPVLLASRGRYSVWELRGPAS